MERKEWNIEKIGLLNEPAALMEEEDDSCETVFMSILSIFAGEI